MNDAVSQVIGNHALPLEVDDYSSLLARARECEFVLLGEASHGTHDFYAMRAEITKRLIEEQGVDAVVVEGDWPDILRVHRHVRHLGSDTTARESLDDLHRFPRWMWRNNVVESFIDWLRDYNDGRSNTEQVGFHGMDLYSMHRSADAVIEYLEGVDPEAAQRARQRYSCMDHHGDPQVYGYTATMGVSESCQQAAVEQLVEMMQSREQWLERDGLLAEDEQFFAERNAALVRHAEAYYRGMFSSRVNTWNLRDRHMVDTVQSLRRHLSAQRGRPARIVVWAHNSHLGDASATASADRGEINVGQLLRKAAGDACLLVGFTTYTGHVTAARDWGEPAEHRWVRPALDGSIEKLFHESGRDAFQLDLRQPGLEPLQQQYLERAIGVIYRPETERHSHYFEVDISRQFDWLVHVDETTALQPLEKDSGWEEREPPDTWPFGS